MFARAEALRYSAAGQRMTWDVRGKRFEKVEELRKGRALISLFNFDRCSDDPALGLTTIFNAELEEALFRVLKESTSNSVGIDLCLYTRGGDTNGV